MLAAMQEQVQSAQLTAAKGWSFGRILLLLVRSIRGTDHGCGRHRLLGRPEGYLDLPRDQSARDGVRDLPQRDTEDCTAACQANGGHATLRHPPQGPVSRVTSARGKRGRSACARHGSRHHLGLVRCRSGNPDACLERGRRRDQAHLKRASGQSRKRQGNRRTEQSHSCLSTVSSRPRILTSAGNGGEPRALRTHSWRYPH